MRQLVISDIHGCYNEFNQLLKEVEYNPAKDKLILLGDYCDRGLKTKDVIEQVMNLKKEWGLQPFAETTIKCFWMLWME